MTLTLAEAEALATAVLTAHATAPDNAAAVARALVAAEADGLASHGLSRLAAYADQAASGKVDGRVRPVAVRPRPAAVAVDAATGFAFPALEVGLPALAEAARETGVAGLAIANSHHFGVAGHPVETLARAGLVGIGFGNSPAAIAPWGGAERLFGTNPIAFACPRKGDADPIVVDLSLSKVARGKVMVAAQRGAPIPEGWALDPDGAPTTDAKAALAGSMVPMGDAKGAALVLMVEILATCFTGAHFGFEASSFFDAEGPAPRVGQLFLAIDPAGFGYDAFTARVETLLGAMLAQDGVRLPGTRRFDLRRRAAAEGIAVPAGLLDDLRRRAGA
ncbi:MAG: Ldh family oxidoreductase [Alphaproteobacteria bacterium]|nr:Ldh family oxidoreductase [Alphaproteobacteria bacterium]